MATNDLTVNQDNPDIVEQKLDQLRMQTKHLMFDSLAHVPVFTGLDPYLTLERFRSNFQEVAEFFKWSETDQLFAATRRLAGKAKETYLAFKSKINSTKELFDILKDRFSEEKGENVKHLEFWEFRQSCDMPAKEFLALARIKAEAALKVQNLSSAVKEPLIESWLMSLAQKNLLPYLRKAVISRCPKDLRELEGIIVLKEKAHRAVPPIQETQAQEFSGAITKAVTADSTQNLVLELAEQIKQLNTKVETLALENKRLAQEKKPEKRKQVICFNCSKPGHTSKVCWLRNSNERTYNTNLRGTSDRNWNSRLQQRNVNNSSPRQVQFNMRDQGRLERRNLQNSNTLN